VSEYLLSQRDSPDVERIRLRLREPLPAGAFDLVNARLLLQHLPSRLEALLRLAGAARPDAWVTAMDPDFTTVALSPTSVAWERTWSAFFDAVVAGGWDPRYGARLCADMRAVGLVDVRGAYLAHCEPGGTVRARLVSLTLERLRDRLIAFGARDEDVSQARGQLEDPASTFNSPTTCVARGRRPL
jgi:hypothetical protein